MEVGPGDGEWLRRAILKTIAEVLQEADYIRKTETGDLFEAFRIAVQRQRAIGATADYHDRTGEDD